MQPPPQTDGFATAEAHDPVYDPVSVQLIVPTLAEFHALYSALRLMSQPVPEVLQYGVWETLFSICIFHKLFAESHIHAGLLTVYVKLPLNPAADPKHPPARHEIPSQLFNAVPIR